MRIWRRYWTRGLLAVVVGVAVFGLSALSPALWDTALLAGWDAGVITWLILTFVAIRQADAQCTWEQSQALELKPCGCYSLSSSLRWWGCWAPLHCPRGVRVAAKWRRRCTLAPGGGVAVALAWLFVHTQFGFYYARLYYDEAAPVAASTAGSSRVPVGFRKGLEFPEGELVDYWAFMYYSFTIAMCYQTSDVTVTGPWMRRMTLLHSIIFFAFVLVILGYTVNAIGTAL
jgi:uncharacterized membrane protein